MKVLIPCTSNKLILFYLLWDTLGKKVARSGLIYQFHLLPGTAYPVNERYALTGNEYTERIV